MCKVAIGNLDKRSPFRREIMIYNHQTCKKLSSTVATNSHSPEQHNPWKEKPWTFSAFSLILLVLNIWSVPIVILITMTGSPSSAVSIATVSVANNAPNQGKTPSNVGIHHLHQPNKLSVNSSDGRNGSTIGLITLSFGGLLFTNQPPENDLRSFPIKKAAIMKRSGGETRITSNQDVTTLALAMENSSSVAIANINSSWNSVFVSIGTPTNNPFMYSTNPNHPLNQPIMLPVQ